MELIKKIIKCFESDSIFYSQHAKFEMKKEKTMKCVICHGEHIKISEVKEEFVVDNDIVYVAIKIPVCKNCGERYYDRRTMQYLEKIEEKLSTKQVELKEVGKVLMYG